MKTMIKDIEIIHTREQIPELDELSKIIHNNYDFMNRFLGEHKTMDISNLSQETDQSFSHELFYDMVHYVYNHSSIKDLMKRDDLLSSLHMESIIRTNGYKNNQMFICCSDMSDDMLNEFIAFRFFRENGSFHDFVNYLIEGKKDPRLFEWLNHKARWITYNYLIEMTIDFFQKGDSEFFEHLDKIMDLWSSQLSDHLVNKKDCSTEYQKISKEEFDFLFQLFLKKIDAPSEWKDIYQNLCEKNYILTKEDMIFDRSECFKDHDGNYKIMISNLYTTKGFCSFVHEFIHYISRYYGIEIEKTSLSEFPSIYYEKEAAKFLVEQGYSKELSSQIDNFRNQGNQSLFIALSSIFNDTIKYSKDGVITREEKKKTCERQLESLNSLKKKILHNIKEKGMKVTNPDFFKEKVIDVDKEIDGECDYVINQFLKDGVYVVNGYQYLLGALLVDFILKHHREDIHSDMVYVTTHLSQLDLNEVIKMFSMDNLFSTNKNDVKKYEKKNN